MKNIQQQLDEATPDKDSLKGQVQYWIDKCKKQADDGLKLLKLMDKLDSKDWPQQGDEYWYVVSDGSIEGTTCRDHPGDHGRLALGNVFRTKEEAEDHKLRLMSMAQRWRPQEDERYWRTDPEGDASWMLWDNYAVDYAFFWIGNCHRTKEDAEKWYKTYGKAFYGEQK